MAGVDGCFHLAAVASVERGVRDWLGTHRTNLTGTIAVFDAACAAGPGGRPVPVVYASSAAVYGDAGTLPIAEESQFDQLTVLSIAPLVARAIREVFDDGSVTSLFDGQV